MMMLSRPIILLDSTICNLVLYTLLPSEQCCFFDENGHQTSYPYVKSDTHGTQTLRLLQQLAPEASIYHGAVIDGGHVYARVLAGLEWALELPITVLSMAVGFKGDSPLFHRVMQRLVEKDVLIVLPSGNDRTGQSFFPANFPGALTVGALEESGDPAHYSSSIHAKEGNCIKPEVLAPGNFEDKKGTSFASTWVAAYAALLRDRFPEFTASEMKSTILDLAQPVHGSADYKSRFGKIERIGLNEVILNQNLVDCAANKIQYQSFEPYIDPYFTRQLNRAYHQKPMDFLIGFSREEELQFAKKEALSQLEVINHFKASQILHLRGERTAIQALVPRWSPELLHATYPPVF